MYEFVGTDPSARWLYIESCIKKHAVNFLNVQEVDLASSGRFRHRDRCVSGFNAPLD
jgi:hypothetical protein